MKRDKTCNQYSLARFAAFRKKSSIRFTERRRIYIFPLRGGTKGSTYIVSSTSFCHCAPWYVLFVPHFKCTKKPPHKLYEQKYKCLKKQANQSSLPQDRGVYMCYLTVVGSRVGGFTFFLFLLEEVHAQVITNFSNNTYTHSRTRLKTQTDEYMSMCI